MLDIRLHSAVLGPAVRILDLRESLAGFSQGDLGAEGEDMGRDLVFGRQRGGVVVDDFLEAARGEVVAQVDELDFGGEGIHCCGVVVGGGVFGIRVDCVGGGCGSCREG